MANARMQQSAAYICEKCRRFTTEDGACPACGHFEVLDRADPANEAWLEALDAMNPGCWARVRDAVMEHFMVMYGFVAFGAPLLAAATLDPSSNMLATIAFVSFFWPVILALAVAAGLMVLVGVARLLGLAPEPGGDEGVAASESGAPEAVVAPRPGSVRSIDLQRPVHVVRQSPVAPREAS